MSFFLKIVQYIVPIFNAVEALIGKHGKEKEDAAIVMTQDILTAVEGVTGKDYVDDALVQTATRGVYQAVAALQNAIKDYEARKAAIAPKVP